MARWYLDLLLIFAACHTNQACVIAIVRQAFAIASERIDQPSERRVDRLLVRQTVEHRVLTASGTGAAFRHVSRLIPVQ